MKPAAAVLSLKGRLLSKNRRTPAVLLWSWALILVNFPASVAFAHGHEEYTGANVADGHGYNSSLDDATVALIQTQLRVERSSLIQTQLRVEQKSQKVEPPKKAKASDPNIEASVPSKGLKAPNVEASVPNVGLKAPTIKDLRQEARATFAKGKADGSLTTTLGSRRVKASAPDLKGPTIEAPKVEASVPTVDLKAPNIEASAPYSKGPSIEAPKVEASVPSVDLKAPNMEASAPELKGPSLEAPLAADVNVASPTKKPKSLAKLRVELNTSLTDGNKDGTLQKTLAERRGTQTTRSSQGTDAMAEDSTLRTKDEVREDAKRALLLAVEEPQPKAVQIVCTICECGHEFTEECRFCRSCGKQRPSTNLNA